MRNLNSDRHWLILGVCAVLAIMVWGVFGQTGEFDFVNIDDNQYIFKNAAVMRGLTPESMAQAFSLQGTDNWVPLTTLTHEMDCQFYGLKAGGHHQTNVVLHAATAILLFLVLLRLTGALWRCAFVAAVFAVHPLRAESVAWVSERKDVLCGVFFMLTLWADANYARGKRPWSWYATTLLFAVLAMMSSPVAVTLPLVLLLLDYWPLQRFNVGSRNSIASASQPSDSIFHLLSEKIPFCVMSAVVCMLTVLTQKQSLLPLKTLPPGLRMENALVSCAVYIGQTIFPTGLAAFYPLPADGIPVWEIATTAAVFAGVTAAVFYWGRERRYLMVGWLWYLIVLLPRIGVVQVGLQARADRHTYFAQIGLLILATWLVADFAAGRRYTPVLATVAVIILGALMWSAFVQTAYWQDSETLWTRALACTQNNLIAHRGLGDALLDQGRLDEAISQYQEALKIGPDDSDALNNLGNALFTERRLDEALAQYYKAIKAHPEDAVARINLANALMNKGRTGEAMLQYRASIKDNPNNALAHNRLGSILYGQGHADQAIGEFQAAIKIDPHDVMTRLSLGAALVDRGQLDQAISQCQEALKLQPQNPLVQHNFARTLWMLVTSTNSSTQTGVRTVNLARQADQLAGGNNPLILRVLAAGYAVSGQWPDAIETGQRALALATDQQNEPLITALQQEIALYQAHSPVRAASPTAKAGWRQL
jgi:protein O-mannosyl-transferase